MLLTFIPGHGLYNVLLAYTLEYAYSTTTPNFVETARDEKGLQKRKRWARLRWRGRGERRSICKANTVNKRGSGVAEYWNFKSCWAGCHTRVTYEFIIPFGVTQLYCFPIAPYKYWSIPNKRHNHCISSTNTCSFLYLM